nr:hypothetical protein [Tanacetum cinerariifolium]
MAARGGKNNLVARRAIDDLIDKVADFNRLIAVAEEKIRGKEIDLEMLEAKAFALVCEAPMCLIRIAVGNAVSGFWHDDENNHSNGNVVKRGTIRLYKFQREYEKPDGIKLSVTFDALNRISGKHRALFSSFLGDMVREHIGLKILSWKKVDSEAKDKLWDEITEKSVTPPNGAWTEYVSEAVTS